MGPAVSIIGGLLAGFLGKEIFDQAWGLIEGREPPAGSWPGEEAPQPE